MMSNDSLRILFFDWTTFGDIDIVEAFTALGHEVIISKLKPKSEVRDADFVLQCADMLKKHEVACVFTSNFQPVTAEACFQANVQYIAWVYDSPQLLLYNQEITYPTNSVFIFDSRQCEALEAMNIPNIYYMPLAVNTKRLDKLQATKEQQSHYACDVAFVGSLYNEEHNLFERLRARLTDYDTGYLEGIMQAQKNVYGYYFMEDILRSSDILKRISEAMPYGASEDNFSPAEYIYANYFLGRRLATIERMEKLLLLSSRCDVHAYTEGDTTGISGIKNMGSVEYYEEMPLAFRHAKININITLRTIQSGIPLRCFDIMGSGGFLLTNYQEDFLPLFEPGVDFVYYESSEDMLEKVDYYLRHEDERQEIARHGHDTVMKHHAYTDRLSSMLDVVMEKMAQQGGQ
ncbi:MAG: glycosyltransferase [Lachnospiraceae bacterium]|nr:glycosyltransferase [Lachnospiraceae bacterium]